MAALKVSPMPVAALLSEALSSPMALMPDSGYPVEAMTCWVRAACRRWPVPLAPATTRSTTVGAVWVVNAARQAVESAPPSAIGVPASR